MTKSKNKSLEDEINTTSVWIKPDLSTLSVKQLIELGDDCVKQIVLKMNLEHKSKRKTN
jgi:hypothetical protein